MPVTILFSFFVCVLPCARAISQPPVEWGVFRWWHLQPGPSCNLHSSLFGGTLGYDTTWWCVTQMSWKCLLALKLTHTPLAALQSSVLSLQLHIAWNGHPVKNLTLSPGPSRHPWVASGKLHPLLHLSFLLHKIGGQKILKKVTLGSDILWFRQPVWRSGNSPHSGLWNPEGKGTLSVKSFKAHSVICSLLCHRGNHWKPWGTLKCWEQRCMWMGLLPLTPPLYPKSPPCCPALTQALDSKMGAQSSHLAILGGKIEKAKKKPFTKEMPGQLYLTWCNRSALTSVTRRKMWKSTHILKALEENHY